MAGAACATATPARFHEDMTVPDWFDPGHADNAGIARPAARILAERRFVVYVGRPAGALHCVTVTYWPWLAGWGRRGPRRWVALPDNDFRLGKRVALASRSPPLSSATLVSTHLSDVPTGSALCRHVSTLAAGPRRASPNLTPGGMRRAHPWLTSYSSP